MSGMLEKTFQETFKVFFSAGKLALPGCSGSGRLQGGLACQMPQTMFPHHISSFPGRSSASLGCHEAHLAAPQGGAVPNANPDLCQVGGQRGLQSLCATLWAGPPPLPRPQVLRNCLEEEDTHSAHKGSHQARTHSPAHTGPPKPQTRQLWGNRLSRTRRDLRDHHSQSSPF